MPESASRRLRDPWPFRRLAVVLTGGGALGAYEIGVLKVLEAVGLRPAIVAGVSVGAINAVVWVAQGFHTSVLERTWRSLRASNIGFSWVTLTLRVAGASLVLISVLAVILTLSSAPELGMRSRFRRLEDAWGFEFQSTAFECLAWVAVGLAGLAMAMLSRRVDDALGTAEGPADPARRQRWLGRALLIGVGLYALVAVSGIPWPWRFHTSLLVVGAMVWAVNRPGRGRDWVRGLVFRLLPETGGRGLWRGVARRRLTEKLVAMGDPSRLVSGDVHLIVSACAVETGRMSYFVNWRDPSPEFEERIRQAVGDVVTVLRPDEVIEAAVASCAVPVLFEPVRFRGHDYLDGGVFSNQPLHAVVADGADAILMILVTPSAGPREQSGQATLVDIGARIQELANWRDLQTELRDLPEGWSRDGDPARVCVVEPVEPLPGSLFGFDPALAPRLIELGQRDAWRALRSSGWLEP